ncbi:unnamed protein product [Moneuplotes crassus]|uniref:Uncharacterized protein n=1 Tax=Euplotes crassus TaxID=5936 RepID=A0AAD1XRP6_EUPCR|nr:unnamed protein product [Moneuplotes crassus]
MPKSNKSKKIKGDKTAYAKGPRNFYQRTDVTLPSNYIWDDFLVGLVSKSSKKTLVYGELVANTIEFSYIIGNIIFLFCMFYYLKKDMICDSTIIYWISLFIPLTYLAYNKIIHLSFLKKGLLSDLKTSFCIGVLIWCFSRILSMFTKSLSFSSIKLLCCILILLHVVTHDYTMASSGKSSYSKSGRFFISLNCIFLTTVLLASRFKNPSHSFAFLLFVSVLFGYTPHIRPKSKVIALTYFMFNCYLLWFISTFWLSFYVSLLVFVCLICPGVLIYMYRFKNDARGPWDEKEIVL